jgi:hypothetical protein
MYIVKIFSNKQKQIIQHKQQIMNGLYLSSEMEEIDHLEKNDHTGFFGKFN